VRNTPQEVPHGLAVHFMYKLATVVRDHTLSTPYTTLE
jgi:hypothetical protein